MTMHKQKNHKSNLLRQIILQRIYSGELKERERLDSCRKLSLTYNLSYVTVNKVIKELCNDGILETIPGSGTIVKSTEPIRDAQPRRILLYDDVIPEKTWNLLTTVEPTLKDVFYPRFVGQYSGLLAKENLNYQADFIYTSDELVETMVQRDMLYPLDDLIEDFAIDLDKYPDKLLDPLRVNGKLYALPICFSNFSLFYNKDMFDAANLSYPDTSWNWNKLLKASRKLTSIEKGKVHHFGFASFVNKGSITNFYLQGVPDDGNPEDALLKDYHTEGLDFLMSLVLDEEVAPPPQDSESFVTDLFIDGKVAMTPCKYKTVQLLRNSNFRWGITNLPMGKVHCSTCAIQGIAINRNARLAASLVEQLLSLTGENMQRILLENFGHLPAYKELAKASPYSKTFLEQLKYNRNIYLNTAENNNLIKNLIFQMFIKVISPRELLEEFRNILKREKYISKLPQKKNKIVEEMLMEVS